MLVHHAICLNTEGPRDDQTKWSKLDRERQMTYDITYLWNLKHHTNEHMKHKFMVTKAEWGKLGVWG